MGTKILWTEETWNPVIGCSRVSEGCRNCYAERMAARHNSNPKTPQYHGIASFTDSGPRWSGEARCLPEKLSAPLRWRKPRKVFVCSMGDLFHEDVPDEFILKVWNVIRSCHVSGVGHVFQVLTKRPNRMADFVSRVRFSNKGHGRLWLADDPADHESGYSLGAGHLGCSGLTNVWLGTSAEDQPTLDERVPHLLRTPAAVRFVSLEPLLGAVDLTDLVVDDGNPGEWHIDALMMDDDPADDETFHGAILDWVIAGGESGPGARPMHPQWVRDIRDQCVSAGVPFFFKQWGEWTEESAADLEHNRIAVGGDRTQNCRYALLDSQSGQITNTVLRVGKKSAGRELDGRTWDEFPNTE